MPWSDNPNAPKIPHGQYLVEKVYLAGNFIGAIFYGTLTRAIIHPRSPRCLIPHSIGIVIILFFQCIGALLNPIDRTKGGIKWGLVVHTVAMFSVLTINAAMSLDLYSISYIDNREFRATGRTPSGPYGYQWHIYSEAISIVPNVMLYLNTCLADGFLASSAQLNHLCG